MGAAGEVPEPEIKPAPSKISEKEQLLWERDLMGLYISSHPLDKYDDYFDEQTHSYDLVKTENDGKIVTLGGIINNVRTIMTKSNTRMAFVWIENKTSEQEIIVFPNLYEKVGGKLEQDNVIKVTGSVNAKDKNGNITNDVKVIADSIEEIEDTAMRAYQRTGKKLPAPKPGVRKQYGRTRATGVSAGARKSNSS